MPHNQFRRWSFEKKGYVSHCSSSWAEESKLKRGKKMETCMKWQITPTGSELAHWPRNPFYWHTTVSPAKGSPSLSPGGTIQEHEKQEKQGH